jgi:hypothetical protein
MDIDKNTAIMTDDADAKAIEQMGTSDQDRSVGLKKYVEGRNLDISEKEASHIWPEFCFCAERTPTDT